MNARNASKRIVEFRGATLRNLMKLCGGHVCGGGSRIWRGIKMDRSCWMCPTVLISGKVLLWIGRKT